MVFYKIKIIPNKLNRVKTMLETISKEIEIAPYEYWNTLSYFRVGCPEVYATRLENALDVSDLIEWYEEWW